MSYIINQFDLGNIDTSNLIRVCIIMRASRDFKLITVRIRYGRNTFSAHE